MTDTAPAASRGYHNPTGQPTAVLETPYGRVLAAAQDADVCYVATDPRGHAHNAYVGDGPDGKDAGLALLHGPAYVNAHYSPDGSGGWHAPASYDAPRYATVPMASPVTPALARKVMAAIGEAVAAFMSDAVRETAGSIALADRVAQTYGEADALRKRADALDALAHAHAVGDVERDELYAKRRTLREGR